MMQRICWPAWISAVSMVAFVLLASGCQSSEPLVPQEIYQQVNDDGREWTYDTAWQNIRALNADLDASELNELSEQALFIASQMERLEKGKATSLTSSWARTLVEEISNDAGDMSQQSALTAAREAGLRLQDAFDGGDFLSAQEAALEVHVLTRELGPEG
jgi:hypothetical protein